MKATQSGILAGLLVLGSLTYLGCGPSSTSSSNSDLTGDISIDGSSTVAPISEAAAEEFQALHPKARVTAGTSGTGGGFKKFGNGEIDIAGASRPIEDSEVKAAADNGIEFVELPVAFDGLTVVVNKNNTFVDHLTVEELKKIWEPESKVKTWADVRPGWPNETIKLYGPGTDSGTFDYWCEAITGKKGASRMDYTQSENDNVLVQGVAGDEYSLGYFGYSYYKESESKLKAVPVMGASGQAVAPTPESIVDGSYQPLSRPLFYYVSTQALDKPAVAEYLNFVMSEDGRALMEEIGFVPLPATAYEAVIKRIQDKKTGTVFHGAEVGVNIEEILSR